MSALYLAFRNIIHRPMRSGFNILLVALSVALILCAILINKQLKNHFENNLAKIDLILTAKGSPLQSILCNLYHIDAPTGNIKINSIKPFLNRSHPIIKSALPLSLGDNAHGFRIVGTTREFLDWYQLILSTGEIFTMNLDAVIGYEVAQSMNLRIGDHFQSGHGLVNEDDATHLHDNEFTVTGILKKSGQVADRLIFTPLSSYWLIHDTHHDTPSTEDSHDHDHDHHGHPTVIHIDSLSTIDESISSLLIRFKSRNIQTLNFGRLINENTDIMSANPAIEMNRLYEITGSVSDVLLYIAMLITLVSALSILISLLQAAHERKKEFAVMRLSGIQPSYIFFNVLFEGLITVIVGFLLGFMIAHLMLEFFANNLGLNQKYNITGKQFYLEEFLVFTLLMIVASIASLLPSIKAYRMTINDNLKDL